MAMNHEEQRLKEAHIESLIWEGLASPQYFRPQQAEQPEYVSFPVPDVL
jgi:hypothetical protein